MNAVLELNYFKIQLLKIEETAKNMQRSFSPDFATLSFSHLSVVSSYTYYYFHCYTELHNVLLLFRLLCSRSILF